MCSINGFTWQDEDLIKRMNLKTAHRGPDGTGIFVAPGISLGHNRLAILDLSSAGAQPMTSTDGRYTIIFNGEIYNFRQLRNELADRYQFTTATDTEVILAAYSVWGAGAFAKLNGIFAFALWDAKEKRLLLVRDPVGVKPLYYCLRNSQLVFSSEIKAILEDTAVPRRLNPLALDLYLRLNYVPGPLSLFDGIEKLPPGAVLTWENQQVSLSNFTKKGTPILSLRPFDETAEELYRRVHESVASQLISDRPVGLYLSGGIDSSAILESMTAAQGRVETFSVGFELKESEQREKFNADFLLARKTARHFGTTHHEVLVSPSEILPLFEEALYHLDEPVSNATVIPMLKLARFAKERVAVILGGDGGDELFGGYERYRLSLLSSYFRRVPSVLRSGAEAFLPALRKLDTAPGIERFSRFHFLKEPIIQQVMTPEAYHVSVAREFFAERFFTEVREPFETHFMETDRRSWLVDESLLRSDKLSMASGLEARVPLLDLPLISYAESIPQSFKLSLWQTKRVLKRAFQDVLPTELFQQEKRGWFSPGAKWLRYPSIAAFAREAFTPSYAPATAELFNWKQVNALLDAHIAGKYHLTILWSLLSLQIWARRFKVTL